MQDPSVIDLIKERAEKTYKIHGHINAYIIGRKLAISTEIISGCLTKLGFFEDGLRPGRFITKADRDKAKDKEDYSHLDDISDSYSLKTPTPGDSSIQEKKEIDYSGYRINELRTIATNKGIKGAFSMKRSELIKRIKAKLNG